MKGRAVIGFIALYVVLGTAFKVGTIAIHAAPVEEMAFVQKVSGSWSTGVSEWSAGFLQQMPQQAQPATEGGWPLWMILALLLWGAGTGLLGYWIHMRSGLRRARWDQTIYRESPQPIILTDLRWKIVDANPAAARMLGYGGDSVTMLTLQTLIETDLDLDPGQLKKALEDGETITYEARVRREEEAADQVLSASTRRVVLRDRVYLLTAFHEITEQKDNYQLFKTFHRRLVDDLPIEVVVLAPQGQYLYANPKAIPDAYLREAMVGETDVEFCQYLGLHSEIALARRSHRRRAVSSRQAVTFEESLPQKDGSYRTYTRIYNPVVDKKGSVSAIVAYCIETTDLKKYQDEIVEVRAEMERVAELKESFLANISHEFRTPLTGILGFAQLLQEDVDPDAREFVDIILRNGRRLMSTLNAMLDLARIHSNFLEMTPVVFNLIDEVKDVAQSLSGLAQEKDLYLRLRATRPEVLVRLDQSHLYRVLENLISNAVKFTNQGGVIVEVSCDAEHAYVHVMDTGVGIRNEFLPFLFEEFNQESSGLSRNFEGTGIGLSVVKRLIELMGGSISVDSEKGEGSTFTLILPVAFPQAREGQPIRSRMLVADKNDEVHTLIEYVLAPYFDIEYAKDFASAMKRAEESEYDIVLMDPELSNRTSASEVLLPLRSLRGYERVPVIALDPQPVRGGEVHYLAAGFDQYLHKPLDKQLLLDVLGRLLAGDRERRRAATALRARVERPAVADSVQPKLDRGVKQ